MFKDRKIYRQRHQKKGLVSFDITARETNLNIQADSDFSEQALAAALEVRQYIENYITANPVFAHSLVPLETPAVAPAIIRDMIKVGQLTGTGPMASVAGAVAEYTGKKLLTQSSQVVVENGGDIFIKSDSETTFTVYAGTSPLSMKAGIKIKKKTEPFAMCTSSGSIGHSKSFGKADAATVLSSSCCLADAAATALCNRIQAPSDIEKAVNWGKQIPGIDGLVIIMGKQMGLWGELQLVPM